MADLYEIVEHHTADNDGVEIHYVATGSVDAPLIVMVHGFPDYWYTWRKQIDALRSAYRVAAVDLRGYNLSSKPKGVENYTLDLLGSDVVAVIKNEGRESATIMGHDWGGAVSWALAMGRPNLVENLVILNLPHPRGLSRELANSPDQQRSSQYAYNFQQENAHLGLSAEILVGISQASASLETQARYLEAFKRSDIEAMLNYYKANYPKPGTDSMPEYPAVQMPVLMFHGLKDQALLPGALNETWNWINNTLTLVTIPDANHWVQNDAAGTINETTLDWLNRRYAKD